MLRSLLLLLVCGLCSVQIFGVRALFENFIYTDSTPKCCKQDELLFFNKTSSEFACFEDYERDLQIFSLIKTNKLVSDEFCVDSVINEDSNVRKIAKLAVKNSTLEYFNLTAIPKCCPRHTVYDTKNHRCVPVFNGTLSIEDSFAESGVNQLFAIKAGLSDCQYVIGDYEVSTLQRTDFDHFNSLFISNLNESIPYGSYCVDEVLNSLKFIVRVCHKNFDVCKRNGNEHGETVRCIRKCCPDGKLYKNSPKCVYDFTQGLNFENDSKVLNAKQPYATIQGHNCRKYLANLDWEYTLDDMGYINLDVDIMTEANSPFEQTYCFENYEKNATRMRRLFLCFKYFDKNEFEYQIIQGVLILSCICLILTLLGYIVFPEMQNLHGRTLMGHCSSLLVAFLLLLVVQFCLATLDKLPCRIIGYLIMYAFLTAFMWSNIMCFDIWWTFGSLKHDGINEKSEELKRFICYCAYSLIIPALIVTTAGTIQYIGENYPHTFSDTFKSFIPTLGRFNCFFEQGVNTLAFLVWFILPLAVITVCNFVLYIKTVMYYYQVKRQIVKMQDKRTDKNEKSNAIIADLEKLTMAVKLFLVMGISWLFESISVCFIPVPATGILLGIQITFDVLNGLQGVFIFLIFVMKGKFFKVIKKKLRRKYQSMKRSHSLISTPTASTYVSYVNNPKAENRQ